MALSRPAQMPQLTGLSRWLTLLLAIGSGLISANVYYAQPLIGPISTALGLSPQAAGLIVTMTQVGYAAGLLLVVPLADLFENRLLVLVILCVAILALLGAALSTHATSFLVAALFIGAGSTAVQVLVPYAAHLAPAGMHGQAVGNVMAGLMLGIMLASPASIFIAATLSWPAVFFLSALMMTGLAVVLAIALPSRQPVSGLSYVGLLVSMARLARKTPILQRRAFYHAGLFGAFSLFWTTVPMFLADTFHMSKSGIALFLLAAGAGVIAAPIAGQVADRGWSKPATAFAMIAVAASLLFSRLGMSGSRAGLAILVLTAVLLDFGVTTNFVLGQRAIFSLGAEFRGRLNGLYMSAFFAGGAVCSTLGAWAYAQGGWSLATWIGLGLPVVSFVGYLTEPSEALLSASRDPHFNQLI